MTCPRFIRGQPRSQQRTVSHYVTLCSYDHTNSYSVDRMSVHQGLPGELAAPKGLKEWQKVQLACGFSSSMTSTRCAP